MRSALSLLFGLAMVSLIAAGCSGAKPASTPATGKSGASASDQKSAAATKSDDSSTQADAKNGAPLVEAAKARMDDGNSVTIKAVDEKTGQVIMITFKPIYFDFDKYTIRPEYQSAVEYDAAQLRKVANLKVVIEGHCDERGTTEYNLALGEHRAAAVMKGLSAAGVKHGRLKTVSYGKERPVDTGHTEDAWSKNRRSLVRES